MLKSYKVTEPNPRRFLTADFRPYCIKPLLTLVNTAELRRAASSLALRNQGGFYFYYHVFLNIIYGGILYGKRTGKTV